MRIHSILIGAALAALLASPAQAELAKCKMTFSLSGWSLVYKQMKGDGKVTCSNGQSASVKIESHGAGFTIGKSDVLNGTGTFSEVKDISEIFGTYAKAEASGGATKGGQAQVMTKGEISLALAGQGRGWDVGVSVGGLTIKRP
ncbi:MAG: hypothetical protein QNK04_02725 [Myxococcota bacterium]|nr:hypothetical protein [Myxococcota bacterium]